MNTPPDPARLLRAAVAAARTAGRHALDQTARRHAALTRSIHDVKLELDVECQRLVRDAIAARFPGHAVTGEEDAVAGARRGAGITWVVDPIDGTVNFSHGLPFWCCSVAALHRGHTLAGAVFAPALDLCYTAALGRGAFCNGKRIRVSRVDALEHALLLTGSDTRPDDGQPPFRLFETLARRFQRARILGAAALDICRVAHGQADAYFEGGIYLWDIAAARLVVTEAGGQARILRRQSGNRLCFLAATPRLFAPCRRLLESAWKG